MPCYLRDFLKENAYHDLLEAGKLCGQILITVALRLASVLRHLYLYGDSGEMTTEYKGMR